MNKPILTHIDKDGASRMVDVSNKNITERIAVAHASVTMNTQTFSLIMDKQVAKGDVLEVARVAGIMAAKKTSELIPMCHPLNINSVNIDYTNNSKDTIEIMAEVKITAKTGVEMEALTAVSVCSLTIYDMCKSADKSMLISDIYLARKTGGKSGTFERG
ncbi:MAG: cyclic pyranopterin monophosphate synthase MoaC [Candidatus Scalindua sp.]|jgi:cyclic pyranopterin phosphate synthase|nr:cyclic pyranopterin monophosphate synthase MoaC [Candidatus Scalindua sp.]MBT5307230.1 cyclic pyranopterin monophosphate synthase MoaC [Candidatus Scalindua sp.]MBT6229019.1 cyclic pyranopterin monophosphate synthase MoaC [Candidatus Scalindua sp.]MBT6563038.1 cyclic pyranopterin monophosphate synthase MoaC [Candidatus Scalindua sp.]MBT7210804.1 cyclic pyranopterin monophosphate synthase MoaC [Candidatus Scalindua sp.]